MLSTDPGEAGEPRCDICEARQSAAPPDDWNGETGAHLSCERVRARLEARWTLDHGQLVLDGEPVGLGLGRTHWGDGAPTAATLDDLERHILALLNRDAAAYGDMAPDARLRDLRGDR